MCGRFTLTSADRVALAAALWLPPEALDGLEYRPRYNIAPTNAHLILRVEREDRRALNARWGLINSWAKDAKGSFKQINARSESVDTRRAFRAAFKARRCVIPADGYYEWTGPKDRRRPHWFHRPDGEIFLFAGLYEAWFPEPGRPQLTFTIITAPANATVAPIHDRMPVILPEARLDAWLDPGQTDPEQLKSLLTPAPDDALVATAVSPRVNSVKNDDPSLLEPEEQSSLFGDA